MPTLTSTGNVNLTSSTNWSPAQIPQAGDDLILNGAHTLTLDADMTLDSVLFQHVSARLAISGTTRSVGATNGWNFTVTPSAVLISTTLTTGMSVTLSGPWFANGNTANFQNGIAASTGGDLTLQTIGANPANILFDGAGTVWSSQRTLISSWSGGTLTTIGRFNWGNSSGSYTAVTMSGGTWTHTNTGTSLFGNQANATLFICSTGTVTVNWSGDVTFNTTGANVLSWSGTNGTLNIQNGSKWLRTGSAGTGWNFQAGNYPRVIGVASSATGFTLNLDGVVCQTSTTRCVSIDMASSTGGRLNWRNQARTIASTDAVVLFFSNTITIDFTNLQISNAGKFQYFEVSTPTLVVDTLTTFTNTSMSAQASFISNTTTLDGKLVTLASNAPTLPTVAQVAAGTSYGYAATPLTGTGLIMDPATLATAMITSFSSLPEVMVRTTIATLASQTSFTLTAGSDDDDVYNGLTAVITDQSTSVQKAVATISDYVGSTRTVTLSAAPGFTIATGDSISIIAGASGGGGASFPSEAPANWIKAAGIQDGAFTAAKFAASSLNGKGDWLTTLGTNAPAGWLNAAAFASGSLNGKGDWSTADALSTVSSTLQSMISALNNLSAKANWFGSLLLEVPDSGTRAYQFELVVRDDEDKLTNLDANPTIALTNTAGTDRSSLITTGIANPSTGRYTLTISVGTSTVNEALKLTATGTISGETRYAVITPQVVDYDTATLINSIYTRIGAPAGASIAADIAATKTVVDTVAADTTTLKSRITANLFSGITYFKNWMAVLMGKTADTTTRAEINATTAGAGYNETTDSLEAIRDRGDAAWTTGGGGGGDATAANQTTIINHLTDIKGAGWSSTTDTLEKIRDAITAALDSVIASVGVTPGALTGWPETMAIGDSYTDDCSRSIHLLVRDSGNTPITSIGSHAFTDADFTATVVLSQGAQRGRVIGTATWVVGPEGYLNVQIPSKESRRAAEGTATVQVLLKWTNSGDQYTLPATTTRWVAQL